MKTPLPGGAIGSRLTLRIFAWSRAQCKTLILAAFA
jgi:hypothetical protein